MTAIRFTNVSFTYPRARPFGPVGPRVFDRLTWDSPSGSTVVLGPNGAGKSTMLRLAASALRPGSGTVTVDGLDGSRRQDLRLLRERVGWMPQHVMAVPGLTSREQVAYAGWLKGMSHSAAWVAAAAALERVGMSAEDGKLATSLSGGQLRRLGLAESLVHKAVVLLLDEPTAGLDPAQRMRFRETVREISQGAGVIVSTHQVDDLTDLFDTVVVLHQGQITFEGAVSAFLALAPSGSSHPGEDAYSAIIPNVR